MSEFSGASLQALCELLNPASQQDDSDSEDEKPKSCYSKMGPGSIGAPKKEESSTGQGGASNPSKGSREPIKSKDIWAEDEVAEGAEFDDASDPRPAPRYDVLYKQSVTTEDMYLQMGNKTPATSSCEDVVINVFMSGTRYADINVDLKDKFLSVRSPKYKLSLHLPHPVDSKNGRARWDGEKEILSVTARMIREYDFTNF